MGKSKQKKVPGKRKKKKKRPEEERKSTTLPRKEKNPCSHEVVKYSVINDISDSSVFRASCRASFQDDSQTTYVTQSN